MLSRAAFTERFGARAIFGMVHLLPLPGAPLYAGSMDEVIEAAVRDARAIAGGGCDGLIVENFGDRPFFKHRVPPETVSAMTRVIVEIMSEVNIATGVNVLRNDASAALAIAAAGGARFIRVNVHTGAMVTDQGIIEGEAATTLRLRARLAPDAAIFADHLVKHARPLAEVDPMQSARDLRHRGLADALVITGAETGAPADVAMLERLRLAVDAPLIVGSGVTEANATAYRSADALIVGTSIKTDGAIDRTKVERLVRAFK